eukprot:CAMPEP_0176425270 /NCGR_PEP_ID=MMETSP0127-20121128/11300_1 /TAXON_ID=938130 /ORGANISM="Platyophrya macrostoma, Strain WH" /LENGTH=326 /DNA_ID=CAMNT_0017806421 /DNA_START=39 /DNA_END=1019 /DNA_ORIENTATION=+
MRTIAFLAVCCIIAVAAVKVTETEPLLTKEFVDDINRRNNGLWTASEDNGYIMAGASREQIKKLMGVKKSAKAILPAKKFEAVDVPASFDAAAQWPHCPTITHIRDQSACGSCWAVAAAESMSDRYCVGGGQKDLLISAANLMECCWWCGSGCEGGDPASAWAYWSSTGLVSDSCQPYPFPKCAHHTNNSAYPPCPSSTYPTPSCSATCTNSTGSLTYYKGQSSYSLSGESSFQQELLTNGPFEVSFDVYEDFVSYKSGVYVQTSNQYLGGHAVRLVGWGTLNGVPYWKIANSWNADWGMNGYFLIKRGSDECGIEDSGAAGLAQI